MRIHVIGLSGAVGQIASVAQYQIASKFGFVNVNAPTHVLVRILKCVHVSVLSVLVIIQLLNVTTLPNALTTTTTSATLQTV